jgi:hypothetical protein
MIAVVWHKYWQQNCSKTVPKQLPKEIVHEYDHAAALQCGYNVKQLKA